MTQYEKSIKHIDLVRHHMISCVHNLHARIMAHDASKLIDPERSAREESYSLLEGIPFGTDEYFSVLHTKLGPIAQHHYQHNAHHPEHYQNGVLGMTLFDLVEMLCDLRAKCDEKNLQVIDLDTNRRIYNIPTPVYEILLNTVKEMNF